jgi:hypothetical protein
MISLVLLLLAVWWGQSAISAFPEIIANESVEPTQVAGSINGTLQSNFLFQVSVVGFAASTLVVALAHRK